MLYTVGDSLHVSSRFGVTDNCALWFMTLCRRNRRARAAMPGRHAAQLVAYQADIMCDTIAFACVLAMIVQNVSISKACIRET